jgi:tetratricopeptide (TPR) repeat protein
MQSTKLRQKLVYNFLMSRQTVGCFVLLLVALCLAGFIVYQIPPVNERLAWRVEQLQASVRYVLNPPQKEVFQPVGQTLPKLADQLPTPMTPPRPSPSQSTTMEREQTAAPTVPGPTPTPIPTSLPTLTPTPLPAQAMLEGITHWFQGWNNCGPTNLAMALSFWDWQGDQYAAADYLKPNTRDKNVMPYEMVDFVNEQTDLRALFRVGGDLEMLKAFVAAGFPVIVEKGFEGVGFEGWMGHYQVVNGYDDAARTFFVQDSYKQNGPNVEVSYDDLLKAWRAFNYTYIVPYPPEREGEVLSILGPQVDANANYQSALQKARDETADLTGRDLFFAWFNQGSSLVALHDYQNAATAYDAAFANYANLPEAERPYRMLWYQTGPYFAYYYTGRYQDVIDLANFAFKHEYEKVLEESLYWRGMAELALGDTKAAIADFRKAVKAHPGFIPAVEQLNALGVNVK